MTRISASASPADWTDLHKAAASTDPNHVLNIVEKTDKCEATSLDQSDVVGMTALHVAAQKGNLLGLTVLLSKGANPNATDDDDWNGIHHASYNGHCQAVKYLIDAGTNVNKQARGGTTPLHLVAGRNDDKTAIALLTAGALKVTTDEYGRTPADIARARGYLELAKLLAP